MMMKSISKIFLMMAAVVAAVSCNEVNITEPTPTPESGVTGTFRVAASTSSSEATKVDIDTEGVVTWNEFDQIVITHSSGNGQFDWCDIYTIDPETISENGKYAEFVGAELTPDNFYMAYNCVGEGFINSNNYFQCSYNYGDYDPDAIDLVMQSCFFFYDGETTPEFTFDHKSSLLELNMEWVGDEDYTCEIESVAISSGSYSAFVTDVVFNSDRETLYGVDGATQDYATSSVELELSETITFGADSPCVLQVPVSWNQDITQVDGDFSFTIRTTDGSESTLTKPMKVLVEGTRYVVSLNFEQMEAAVVPSVELTLSQISADNVPESDLWIITDAAAESADFLGLSLTLMSLKSSGREISLEFPNLVEFPEYAIYGGSEYYSYFTHTYFAALVSVKADVATSVGSHAFTMCRSLTSIEMPELTYIGDSAFRYCSTLERVSFPKATNLNYYTLASCYKLTDLSIATAEGVELYYISTMAFHYLTTTDINLTVGAANAKYVNGNTLYVGNVQDFEYSGVFKSIMVINENYQYLENFSADTYPTDTDMWVIKDEVATTEDFEGLQEALIALGDSGREIELYFPNLVTIPYHAFNHNSVCSFSIEAVSATTVEKYAINSNSLTSLNLPLVTTVDDYAFAYCSSLEEINLPLATTFGNYTFISCEALETITLPSATTMGHYPFEYCSGLEYIELTTIVEIGTQLFRGADNVTTIKVPAVSYVESQAFYDSTKLTDLTLGIDSSEAVYFEEGTNCFENMSTTEINLTVGLKSIPCVNGNIYSSLNTVFDVYYDVEFKSITIEGAALREGSHIVTAYWSSTNYMEIETTITYVNATTGSITLYWDLMGGTGMYTTTPATYDALAQTISIPSGQDIYESYGDMYSGYTYLRKYPLTDNSDIVFTFNEDQNCFVAESQWGLYGYYYDKLMWLALFTSSYIDL